ncbi:MULTISPECIES: barstar family protein [unclassified Luteococcus]|uniref:barstar family protein n=1 Tax=unclassified Luteococcus TaxID=2639923 RepID=UPI00313C72BF
MTHPFTPEETPGRRVVVDLDHEDLRQNLARLGDALGLPAGQEVSLDSLTDALRGLTEPLSLVLVGWQYLAVEDPGAWAALRAVLDRAVAANDQLQVVHGPITREGNPAALQ